MLGEQRVGERGGQGERKIGRAQPELGDTFRSFVGREARRLNGHDDNAALREPGGKPVAEMRSSSQSAMGEKDDRMPSFGGLCVADGPLALEDGASAFPRKALSILAVSLHIRGKTLV